MKRFFLNLLLISFAFTATSIFANDPGLTRGEGEFEYTAYAPLGDKPVTVFYYVPLKGNLKKMPILFAMHGAERSGKTNIETWKYFAEENRIIVIAPQFSTAQYLENDYQFGGVAVKRYGSEMRPEEQWTYNIIESLFDHFKKLTENKNQQYDIWGHSAGGQFVHRFLLAMPNARVRIGVASNPGNYAFPLIDGMVGNDEQIYGWPFSLLNTPFSDVETLKKYFSKHLVVHVGDRDTNPDGPHASTHPAAVAQGVNRFERAKNFYETSRKIAKEIGAPFKWELVVVKGVGHTSRSMVYGTSKRVDNKRVYSTDITKPFGAFNILYGQRF